jgi:large subunit ribosomal protein L15
MVINKRSKLSRARGSWTHGGGSKKKRRGAGHRGGRGRAGSGKRGDAKKTKYWSTSYQGKYGFNTRGKPKLSVINILFLENSADRMIKEGKGSKKNDEYHFNLKKMGYNKLISKGNIKKKLFLTIDECTQIAKTKVEKAGGSIVTPNKVLKEESLSENNNKKIKSEKISKPEEVIIKEKN